MTTTTTEARCNRCGALADALIHTGDHPERCHPFETTAVDTCPTWCTSTEQEHDDELFGPHHYGPDFGSVTRKLSEEGTAIAFVHLEVDPFDTERLRKLAVDALAAAEWLEAQR